METAKAEPQTADVEAVPSVDSELVNRSLAGDEAALRCLFERHQQYVYSLCLGMLGHREDAEDAAQEAFVNAFSRLDRFRGKSSFRTWLHRIAVNVCIDFLRRQAKRSPIHRKMCFSSGVNDCSLGLQVREALMQLPPNYRAALVLREVNGFTYAEIAQALNCSIDDVKNWLYRGRKMFKEHYER